MLELDRPRGGEVAVLVHVDLGSEAGREDLEEFLELARSAGVETADVLVARRAAPDPRLFLGSGKAAELRERARQAAAEVILVNHALTPSQERNLERETGCRVIDRTGLILDIFAQRARGFEGKLQVELAQLKHLASRLVRGWTHLERQKGGIGLRGPGETQLETDRRLVGQRIHRITRRLERVRGQRQQGRRARRRAETPTVAVVGYTNAGKSTLFNRLAASDAYAADKLFATLDPTLRGCDLGGGTRIVLADTVGFIRHLPHDLVAAFRSTLEETREAALLLHLVDAADEDRHEKVAAVEAVLAEIGAAAVPRLRVLNKIDLLEQAPRLDRDAEGRARRVWVSARSGEGLDLLGQALREHFAGARVRGWLRLAPEEGRLRARLFDAGAVRAERIDPQGATLLEIDFARERFQRLCVREGLSPERLERPAAERLVAGAA